MSEAHEAVATAAGEPEPEPVPPPIRLDAADPAVLEWLRARQRASRLAGAPAVILLVANVVAGIAHQVPEFGLTILVPALLRQLAPLVAAPVASGGALLPGMVGAIQGVTTLLLVAAVVLGFASRQGSWWRLAVLPAAVVTAVAAFVVVAVGAATDPVGGMLGLVGASIAGIMSVIVAWRTVRARRRGGGRHAHPFARRSPELTSWRTRWLALYLAALPWPFAVGRLLTGAELRDRAAEIAASGSSAFGSTLFSPATPLAYLVGAAIGLAVWAAARLVPPRAETVFVAAEGRLGLRPSLRRAPVIASSVVAVIALVLAVALTAPAASGAARTTAEQSRTTLPFQSDASCPVIERPGSNPPQAIVPGPRCRSVESYAAYTRTGAAAAQESLRADVPAVTPAGDTITAALVVAVYDPIVVIASSTTGERYDTIGGYHFEDAGQGWRFQCPGGEAMQVRFAGAGPDDPAAGRQTAAGDPEAVFVGCVNGIYRIDPRTGAGF